MLNIEEILPRDIKVGDRLLMSSMSYPIKLEKVLQIKQSKFGAHVEIDNIGVLALGEDDHVLVVR